MTTTDRKRMINQLAIEFQVHTHENNRESQMILQENVSHFTGQCKTVFEALMRGEVLTTSTALLKYKVGDLRARIRDIKNTVMQIGGNEETFHLHEKTQSTRYKLWWMDSNDIILNKILIENLNT